MRRAGCPQPAAAGTSVLLQTMAIRALRRGGLLQSASLTAPSEREPRRCGAGAGRRGRRPLQCNVGGAHPCRGGGVLDAPVQAVSILCPHPSLSVGADAHIRPCWHHRFCVRNSRRDVGIAPYAKLWIGHNSYPFCVGRAHPSPLLLALLFCCKPWRYARCGAKDSFSQLR